MASSSSTNYRYDVFLSFRGTDTRNNFTSHLHEALCRKNVKAFIDNNIDRGEEITPFLEGIIEGVKLSIIVFSSDYASSTFCLDELVKIIECKETKAQIVLPIFYKVYPSDEIYKEAFTRHEQTSKQETLKSCFWWAQQCATFCLPFKRHEEIIGQEMKVKRWRSSFQKALELAGWHIDENRNEATIIEEITRDVLKRLNCQFEGAMKSTSMVGQISEYCLKAIMQCLMDDENPKVGVWGMGGVGKTFIVTHVYNILRNDTSFSRNIYWVTVSKDSSVAKLQGDIAKVINLNLSREDNESKRAAKLFDELKRINKFVLILDDVWEPFETEDVGIPLTGGQKLLFTTRDLGVCQRMMCQPIEVEPLLEHEAMDLFMKELKNQISDSRECREIAQSIVKECAGLPLAIVVVARRMRGVREIRNWRNTLRELQKPCEGENNEMEKKVYNPLKFSYDNLPNDRCRQCFLYCSLFPEDHEFEREHLIEYWIGEGLIDELESRTAVLDKGYAILDELIQSSLLNEDNFRQIKMHDVIRDMARINVKVGLQCQDASDRVEVANETTSESLPNSVPRCSKLKTLVLKDIREVSGCLFANMQSLNVLQMTDVTSIPDSISNLGNLRVLIIYRCACLECIPSLVGLENLRYLKISWNEMLKEIPKGIERLLNLRVLNLSGNVSLSGSFPSGIVEKLSHLQTLHLVDNRIEVEPEALISLEKLEILRLQFYDLQKLNCYVKSGHWQRLLDYQINYRNSDYGIWRKGMTLDAIGDVEEWKGETSIFLPDDIRNLQCENWDSSMFNALKNPTFADLETIHIARYQNRYLFAVGLAQQILHNVQELCIAFCHELEEIIRREEEWVNPSNYVKYPTIVLPNLKILFLFHLGELKSIYGGRMLCPSLKLIKIFGCDKVERLPFCIEKEGNKQNSTIKLGGLTEETPVSRSWWDSLQWDDPNAKSIYHPIFSSETELQLYSGFEDESKGDAENKYDSGSESELEHEDEGESEVDTQNESQTG